MDDLGLSADAIGVSSMFTGEEEVFAFARCVVRIFPSRRLSLDHRADRISILLVTYNGDGQCTMGQRIGNGGGDSQH